MKFSLCATAKIIIKSHLKKEDAIVYPFNVGIVVATGAISILITVLVSFLMIARSKFLLRFINNIRKKKLLNMDNGRFNSYTKQKFILITFINIK